MINQESADYIKCIEEWVVIPNSLKALQHLREQNKQSIVITNQSGVARGLFNMAMLESVHDHMHATVNAAVGISMPFSFARIILMSMCVSQAQTGIVIARTNKTFNLNFEHCILL